MKLLTYTPKQGKEKNLRIGLLHGENSVIDLQSAAILYLREVQREKDPGRIASEIIPHDMVAFLSRGPEAFDLASRTAVFMAGFSSHPKDHLKDPDGRPVLFGLQEVEIKAPVPRPGKIIAMGLNFMSHVLENQTDPPEYPVGFLKAPSSVVGPYDPVPYPRATKQLDYEVELAVIIGRKGKEILKERAWDHIAGYCILNDLSARDLQAKEMKKRLILLSKSLDGLGPMGPWLVTRDEIPDPDSLLMELYVNDEKEPRQRAWTREMIFKIPDLVHYWSQMTLEPGDIITSGTPAGIGLYRKPAPEAWLLKPGDVVRAKIEKLGEIRNRIVS
jgi:acylpyruvate hydrolase